MKLPIIQFTECLYYNVGWINMFKISGMFSIITYSQREAYMDLVENGGGGGGRQEAEEPQGML